MTSWGKKFTRHLVLSSFISTLFVGSEFSAFGFDGDLFGKVSVNPHEDGILYDNRINFISVSYIPEMQENRPYCSLSFVAINNLGCDASPDVSDGLLVSDGMIYDNYDDKLPSLNCDVESIRNGSYKLTANIESPLAKEKHEFTFSRRPGDFFKLEKYAGYNIYFSESRDRYATEFYEPIRAQDDGFSHRLYRQLPTNCSRLTVPALPE